MKTLNIKQTLLIATFLLTSSLSSLGLAQSRPQGVSPDELDTVDVNAILNSGSAPRTITKTFLEEGIYKTSRVYNKYNHKDQKIKVIVQSFVNDTNKNLVIMAPQDVLEGKKAGNGWIYQARPVRKGQTVMFSPLVIDGYGNIVVDSEQSSQSPVVLVQRRPGKDNRYPYVLQSRNGGFTGELSGMKKEKTWGCKKLHLKNYPTSEEFVAVSSSDSKAMVMADEVAIYDGDGIAKTYNIVPLNGENGSLAGLVRSEFDTMLEDDLEYEQIKRVATFYKVGKSDKKEKLLIATPLYENGYYKFEVFSIAKNKKSIIEIFFANLFGLN